jgi:aldose 1-epimerase
MTSGTRAFGTTKAGEAIEKITIGSPELSASFLTLGAILNDVRLKGVRHSLTLGGMTLAAYDNGPMRYFGAIVGPVANRIAKGKAHIGGKEMNLPLNENGKTTLHGGETGMHGRAWTVTLQSDEQVTMMLNLADGEEGYPGNRTVFVSYYITGSILTMEITATTDAPTIFAPANHSYWNLSGAAMTSGHVLTINADRYTPVDADLIPTGEAAPVAGTPFDFRYARVLKGDTGHRYDHNFCIADARRGVQYVARLEAPSGLLMEIESTEPGLQVYDGVGVSTAPHVGQNGAPYNAFAGIALEAQCWPDGMHHAKFPSVALMPGDTYRQTTRWNFRTSLTL